jgi:hypothetical protein
MMVLRVSVPERKNQMLAVEEEKKMQDQCPENPEGLPDPIRERLVRPSLLLNIITMLSQCYMNSIFWTFCDLVVMLGFQDPFS